MKKEQHESLIFNYSNIFFSYYFNNHVRCHKMIEDHTLVYVYGGELLVEDDGRETKIHKGSCAFVRKNIRVTLTKRAKGDEQFQAIFMVLTRNFLREFYQTINPDTLPKQSSKFKKSLIQLSKTPAFESLFQSMTPYFNAVEKPADNLMKLKLQEGVYNLLNTDERFFSCLFDFTEPWKIDILDFLEDNFMYDLTVDDIANYTGRSLAAFKRDFKKVSVLPPQKWLMEKRLEVAHDKLRSNNKKVSDVYLEVGFKNLSHFSTAFKRQFGYAPTQ